MTSVEEVERWVLLAYDAQHPEEQARATWMLQDWLEKQQQQQQQSNCIPILIQLTTSTKHETVFFYALTTLSRMKCNVNELTRIREYLLKRFPYEYNSGNSSNNINMAIVNKVAFMLVQQIVLNGNSSSCSDNSITSANSIPNNLPVTATDHDQLNWNTVWQDIFQLITHNTNNKNATTNGIVPTLLFLKTFYCLLDDIQSMNHHHHEKTKLKHLKEAFYNESLTTYLLEHTVQIYNQSASLVLQPSQQQHQQQQIAILSLSVIKVFFISYYLSQKQYQPVLQTLLNSLQNGIIGTEGGENNNMETLLRTIPICSMAIECFHEFILGPGLFTEQKLPILLPLLESLSKILLVSNHPIFITVSNSNQQDTVPVQIAKLIDVIGIQVLSFFQEQQQQQNHSNTNGNGSNNNNNNNMLLLWNAILELVITSILPHQDMDVAASVLPFITYWINYIADYPNDIPHSIHPHIPSILTHIYHQMKYDDDDDDNYDGDDNDGYDENNSDDEMHAQEEIIRSDLCKLYVKFVRISPDICLQFLIQFMTSLQQQQKEVLSWHNIEAFLRLLYHYCEGIRPAPGMDVIMQNETFVSLIVNIQAPVRSAVTPTSTPPPSFIVQNHYNNRRVMMLYYQTIVRYYPVLLMHTNLLQQLLNDITGNFGLQHSNSFVRSRCCYLLLRLIQSIINDSSSNHNIQVVLTPLVVETAVMGIQRLLTMSSSLSSTQRQSHFIRPDDKLYLFETIGLLVGKTNSSPMDQQRFLKIIITPHVQSINNILNTIKQSLNTTNSNILVEEYEQVLSNSIASMAYVSKGFKKPPNDDIIQSIFIETLHITLSVFQTFPTSEVIRNKTMIFLQRMIQCIIVSDSGSNPHANNHNNNTNIVEVLPNFLHPLIEHCTNDDILFVSQLLNQICLKYRQNAAKAMDTSLLPFLRKCQYLSEQLLNNSGSSIGDPTTAAAAVTASKLSHVQVEQISLQKLAFGVLQHVVTNRVTSILVSSTNASSLEMVLQTMNHGAINVQDASVKKTCIRFFRELLDQRREAVEAQAAAASASNGTSVNTSNTEFWHPQQEEGLLQFIGQILIPGMVFQCMLLPTFNIQDAQQARNIKEFAHLLYCYRTASESKYDQYFLGPIILQQQRTNDSITRFRSAMSVQEMNSVLREWIKFVKDTSAT